MKPERETEIRALAVDLVSSARHRRIGNVVLELLAEVDRLRGRGHSATIHRPPDPDPDLIAEYTSNGRRIR